MFIFKLCVPPDMAEIIETRPRAQKDDGGEEDDKKKKSGKNRQGKESKKDSKSDAKSKTDKEEAKAEDLDYYVHYSECESQFIRLYVRSFHVVSAHFLETDCNFVTCVAITCT